MRRTAGKMKSFALLLVFASFFAFGQEHLLRKEISNITRGKKATVAVSVSGIDFPFEFHNENAGKKLPTLSVYKFHIAAAVLDLVDKGKLNLDQPIFIKKSDLLDETWSPIREKYPSGNISLPLYELIDYTVAQSDNNGCDILLRLIGGVETVQKFMDSKNVKDFQIRYNEELIHKGSQYVYPNFIAAKSMTRLLKDFQQNKILSEQSTAFLYIIMLGTSTGSNKLKEKLPVHTVAHKTGSSGTDQKGFTIAENDAGIIKLPNGHYYAITVFVNDSYESAATNTRIISEISKSVWDLLSKN